MIGSIRNRGLLQEPDPELVALFVQNPDQNVGFKSVAIRTAVDPAAMRASVRGELRRLDPGLPFAER